MPSQLPRKQNTPLERLHFVLEPYLGTDGQNIPKRVVNVVNRLFQKVEKVDRRKHPRNAAGGFTKPHALVLHYEDLKQALVDHHSIQVRDGHRPPRHPKLKN